MPKVPDEQTPTFNTTQVPGVQFPYRQEFGKVGRALEGMGQKVEGDALIGNDIYRNVQRQKDLSDSQNAEIATKTWMDQTHRDLLDSSPDGFVHDLSTATPDNPHGQVVYDGDKPRTIAKEFYDKSNEHYMQTQDNLSPQAQEMYRMRIQGDIAARYSQLNNDAHTKQIAAVDQSTVDRNSKVYQEFSTAPWDATYGVQERPDLNKFSDYAQRAQLALQQQGGIVGKNGQFQPGLRNQLQIHQMNVKQMDEYSTNWMESSITKMMDEKHDKGPHFSQDLHNLLDVVQGQDPQTPAFQKAGKPTIFGSLSEAQREKFVRQLQALVPTAGAIDKGEFKQNLEDYMAKAERGAPGYEMGNNGPSKMNLMSWMSTFRDIPKGKDGKPQITDAEIVGYIGQMTASEAKGSVGGAKFDLLPQNRQGQVMAGAQTQALKTLQQTAQMRGFNYTADSGEKVAQEVAAHGAKHIQEIETEKQKDWTGFLAGTTGRVGPNLAPEYRSSVLHAAENLDYSNPAGLEKNGGLIQQSLRTSSNYYQANYGSNMSYWRPISKDNAAKLGGALSSMSPTQQAKAIDNLKNAYGKAFPNLMDTLIDDNVISNKVSSSFDWKFIPSVPSFQGRVAQLSAMQNIQATKELYEAQFTNDKWDGLRSKVDKAWHDDIANIVRTNPLNGDQNAYAASILNKSTAAVAQMRIQTGGDVDDVIKNSKAEAFKGYPTIEKVGNHSDFLGGWLSFDKGPQVKTAFPENLSDQQKTTIKQNLASIMTEDGLKGAGVSAPAGTPFADKFHAMAAKNITSINLTNSKDGPGYTIDYQGINKDGLPNGQVNHLMDEHGNTKFFPLNDLLVPRGGAAPTMKQPLQKYQPGKR